jgi:hypothetical protein
MPSHRCGNNGYRGIITQTIAGQNAVQWFTIFLRARLTAETKVKDTFDRNCPTRCKKKTANVAYQIASIRFINVRVNVGGIIRNVPGLELVYEWRLFVQCINDPKGANDKEPFELPWEILDELLRELYPNSVAVETELEVVN